MQWLLIINQSSAHAKVQELLGEKKQETGEKVKRGEKSTMSQMNIPFI